MLYKRNNIRNKILWDQLSRYLRGSFSYISCHKKPFTVYGLCEARSFDIINSNEYVSVFESDFPGYWTSKLSALHARPRSTSWNLNRRFLIPTFSVGVNGIARVARFAPISNAWYVALFRIVPSRSFTSRLQYECSFAQLSLRLTQAQPSAFSVCIWVSGLCSRSAGTSPVRVSVRVNPRVSAVFLLGGSPTRLRNKPSGQGRVYGILLCCVNPERIQ
jgi:hypothetical protein